MVRCLESAPKHKPQIETTDRNVRGLVDQWQIASFARKRPRVQIPASPLLSRFARKDSTATAFRVFFKNPPPVRRTHLTPRRMPPLVPIEPVGESASTVLCDSY